jgi:hypothetical protein
MTFRDRVAALPSEPSMPVDLDRARPNPGHWLWKARAAYRALAHPVDYTVALVRFDLGFCLVMAAIVYLALRGAR